jgi:hypothetical protein
LYFCILDETVNFVVEVDKILGTYRLECVFLWGAIVADLVMMMILVPCDSAG